MPKSNELNTELAKRTKEGTLYRQLEKYEDRIECFACAHRCKIKNGKSGICNVRFNANGVLKVPFNYVGSFQCDPIEKKPFFHAYPNSLAMSFGMLGCDLHCGYCQNWVTSQTLRDDNAGVPPRDITPDQFVSTAMKLNARAVVSTYNEPLITAEWAVAVFEEAKKHGLATGFVSNGNATPEVLDFIRPVTDLYKVDLKSFQDKNYRALGGRLDKILDGIKGIHQRGFWLEIVTLLIPGFNDSEDELRQMAGFLADVSPDIPWHVTAFHKDYKMRDPANTTVKDLLRAAKIGKEEGLNFVYAGNLPGRVGRWENTLCPNCDHDLIERRGYHILNYDLDEDRYCPECRTEIAGIWETPTERESMFHFL